LELTAEEETHLGAQLGHVLEYIEKLNSLDVTGVEPMAHAMPRVNVMRPDLTSECLPHEEAMLNAPSTSNGLFKVPKIVE
jgi:aspartyl-tRNA(Asn)/glutamyl-tRNA(Gln) amidotransferase subunit C